MQVILLERVAKLGDMGETVEVKNGYGRNYLLPQGKALRATKANLVKFEAQRATLEARNAERRTDAEDAAGKLDGQSYIVIRQASEGGSLYGSVTARDVAEMIIADGHRIERNQVVLEKPVKEVGVHPVAVHLYGGVEATVTVNVARSQEEAEIQAQGKSVAQLRAEQEAAERAEFDVQNLFDDDEDSPLNMEIVAPRDND